MKTTLIHVYEFHKKQDQTLNKDHSKNIRSQVMKIWIIISSHSFPSSMIITMSHVASLSLI